MGFDAAFDLTHFKLERSEVVHADCGVVFESHLGSLRSNAHHRVQRTLQRFVKPLGSDGQIPFKAEA